MWLGQTIESINAVLIEFCGKTRKSIQSKYLNPQIMCNIQHLEQTYIQRRKTWASWSPGWSETHWQKQKQLIDSQKVAAYINQLFNTR
jgi:hypothetical protein